MVFKKDEINIKEMMILLNMGDKTARDKVKLWIEAGFIEPKNPNAQRVHSVVLTEWYEDLADEIRDNPDHFQYLLAKDEAFKGRFSSLLALSFFRREKQHI